MAETAPAPDRLARSSTCGVKQSGRQPKPLPAVIAAAATGLRHVLRRAGIDVLRVHNVPSVTWLGLRGRAIKTVLDVGANVGQFARGVRRDFPDAVIYCFEPVEDAYLELDKWAVGQGSKVRTFKLALGDTSGFTNISVHTAHTPSSSILRATQLNHEYHPQTRIERSDRVQIERLDVVVDTVGPLATDILLKLDVQGYEDRVLLGAPKILAAAAACLLEVSVDLLYEDQANFVKLTTLLAAHDYSYAGNLSQSYGPDGHVKWFDALFLKQALG